MELFVELKCFFQQAKDGAMIQGTCSSGHAICKNQDLSFIQAVKICVFL